MALADTNGWWLSIFLIFHALPKCSLNQGLGQDRECLMPALKKTENAAQLYRWTENNNARTFYLLVLAANEQWSSKPLVQITLSSTIHNLKAECSILMNMWETCCCHLWRKLQIAESNVVHSIRFSCIWLYHVTNSAWMW